MLDATEYGFCLRIYTVVGAHRDATSTGSCYLFSGACDRTGAIALAVAKRAGSNVDRPARLTKTNCYTASDSAAGPGDDGDLARHRETRLPEGVLRRGLG